MTIQDKIDLIEETQELLRQAIHNIDSVIQDLPTQRYYKAYLTFNLRNMIDGDGNPYDANLEKLIEEVSELDEESTCEYSGLPSTSTYE